MAIRLDRPSALGFGLWFEGRFEPESLILAQNERWRHA